MLADTCRLKDLLRATKKQTIESGCFFASSRIEIKKEKKEKKGVKDQGEMTISGLGNVRLGRLFRGH